MSAHAAAWITREALERETGWSRETIRLKLKNGELQARETGRVERNGRPERQFLFAVEPKQGSDSSALVHAPQSNLPLFDSGAPAERSAVPPELRAKAELRYSAIELLLKFRAEKRPSFTLQDGRVITRQKDLEEYIAAQYETSPRNLYRWLKRRREAQKKGGNGFVALADRPRKDKGSSVFDKHPDAAAYLQSKFLNECLSSFQSWEALCRDWRLVLRKKGKPPGEDAARRYLKKLALGLKTLARKGPEAYLSECTSFITRAKQPPMKTWISDHRVSDVLVRNRTFVSRELPLDAAYRPWLTALVDMGSQLIVGFCFSPQPSWRTIHSAIRMAALDYGFPQEFYWDNGEDYKKAKRMLERFDPTKEVLGFNFRVTSAIPKRPRSKPIEAYFTRFARRFDPIWGAAYVGNRPTNRSEHADAAQRLHKRYLEGKETRSPLPTDAEFIACAIQWIHEYNDSKFRQLGGKTPNQVMNEAWPEHARTKVNPRSLDILLWEPVERVVDRGGMVKMDNIWYEPTEEYSYIIANLQGQKIHVLRDPYNLAEAVAVTEDRTFLGELRPKQLIDQDPANPITRDQIQAEMREQRRLKKMHAQQLAMLSLIARQAGWKTERERLLERAAESMAMTGTDGRALPAAVVPGRRTMAPRLPAIRNSQPAFVSDAVAEDAELFREVQLEE